MKFEERNTMKMILVAVGIAILLVLLLSSSIGGLIEYADPRLRELHYSKANTYYKFDVFAGIVKRLLSVVLQIGLTTAILYACLIGLAWLRNKAMLVYPDSRGLFPLVHMRDGELYDPNRAVVSRSPEGTAVTMAALKVQATAALASHEGPFHFTRHNDAFPGQAEVESLTTEIWPELVRPAELMLDDNVSLNNLAVGLTMNNNQRQVVKTSLHKLMHTLLVGMSGWGKSTWMTWLLYQFALANEPLEVVAIDINGSAFNVLHGWEKLRYPVARSVESAIAQLNEVGKELTRRKQLYEQYPLVNKLTKYNRTAPEPLAPWAIVVDEGTNLLNQEGIGEPLRVVSQTARQYGIYMLLSGQSAKSQVIDTQTRENFNTRLCFRASPSSSKVVLDDRAASTLDVPGRAYYQPSGHPLSMIQAPLIEPEDLDSVIVRGGEMYSTPEYVQNNTPDRRAEQARTLKKRQLESADGQPSDREIQKRVWGYAGGSAYDQFIDAVQGVIITQEQHVNA